MARLLKSLEPLSQYKDRKFEGSLEEYVACLRRSTTVYVGNLAFHTTEEQIHELFSTCGPLTRIVMGLDKNAMTPCGFCFVQYGSRRDTEDCVKYLNGARLDERDVRIDFDWGFEEGRQFGRGKSGGQVRDEYRTDYDVGRGGYGKLVQTGLSELHGRPGAARDAAPQALPGGGWPAGDDGRGRKRGRESNAQEERDKRPRDSTAEKNPRFRGERREDDEDDAA